MKTATVRSMGSAAELTTSEPTAPVGPAASKPYHHGDLPNTLRRAAAEVIVERGLGNFSLREVARRAGVSHTAPAHHFGDMQGLLTSLATEGFTLLADEMEAALEGLDDQVERLVAIGQVYVGFAERHPAHFDVMFRQDIVDPDDEAHMLAGLRAFDLLDGTVRALIEAEQMQVPVDVATSLCWASVQGLVALAPKLDSVCEVHDHFRRFVGPELVREFVDLLVNGMRSRHT